MKKFTHHYSELINNVKTRKHAKRQITLGLLVAVVVTFGTVNLSNAAAVRGAITLDSRVYAPPSTSTPLASPCSSHIEVYSPNEAYVMLETSSNFYSQDPVLYVDKNDGRGTLEAQPQVPATNVPNTLICTTVGGTTTVALDAKVHFPGFTTFTTYQILHVVITLTGSSVDVLITDRATGTTGYHNIFSRPSVLGCCPDHVIVDH